MFSINVHQREGVLNGKLQGRIESERRRRGGLTGFYPHIQHPSSNQQQLPVSSYYQNCVENAEFDVDLNHYSDSSPYTNLKSCASSTTTSSGRGSVDSLEDLHPHSEQEVLDFGSSWHAPTTCSILQQEYDTCIGFSPGVKMEIARSEDGCADENNVSNNDETLLSDDRKHKKAAELQDPKTCGVCGDKALGNNFNAITCESCKAFFRRNALRTKEFVCPFSDNCKVDPVTRRFCQKCRLKKCFDIGMKKEWIMTDEEKKIKKQKIEQNRLKRASSEGDPTHPKERVLSSKANEGPVIIDNSNNNNNNNNNNTGLSINSDASSNSNSNDGMFVPNCNGHSQPQPQPMMPHNNNTILLNHPLLNHKIGQQMTPPEIPEFEDNSRSPISHKKIDNTQQALLYTQQQQQMPWSENLENVKKDFYIQNHVSNIPTLDNASQTQMPILASLVRPGISDSPPEFAPVNNLSNAQQVPQPTYGDSDYPKKKSLILQQYNLEHHGQPPNLTNPRDQTEPYIEDLDVDEGDCHSDQNNSQHSPPSREELPPLPLNTMESILSVAISAEFNAYGMLADSHPTHTHSSILNSRELNKAEKAKLNELFYASDALNAPVDQDGPLKIETSDPSLINVINLTDIAIRRLIKMSKKISAFKTMCQEDQIALLKGGCTEMMILRSVVSYDPERDSWNIPHSNGLNLNLGVLKEARGNLYEEHQRFVKSFKPEWRVDYNIMIILCAITLFTPERPNVIHKDVVKLEQDSYYYLLKRYLESNRNGCEAKSTYLQLIQRIAELHILNSNHLRVFLEVNPREVEPLLIEIFDLKQ